MKTAFITGITGQDGSYLAELLLAKNYQVVGMVSAKNDIGKQNIADLENDLVLVEGDLLDKNSLEKIILKYEPDEIYNLAGISFIPTSWEKPILTYDINAMGVVRILEIIRDNHLNSRFFQASSARMFGESEEEKQTEETKFNPKDPYAISKLAAHLNVGLFRKHFGIFACCGILFNHESEKRGEEFVTRKISLGAVKIKLGLQKQLALGNLDAVADWGYAPDYVQGMWLILQQEKADDYILATGELHSVRQICEIAFAKLGLDYKDYVVRDEQFYREKPAKNYYGDSSKAQKILNWKRAVDFEMMIEKMVDYDLKKLKLI
ncbi:GDP-mannose 4,6-dehydratase [Candidatus Beckwithbacteria bacterium]|nr:GDP-mannose 4,6-dehydratase [Candidatus Beckwithbacteria bacterium]